VEQLRAARAAVRPGNARFASLQNEYSLLHRDPEQGVLAECAREDMAFLPYFPLASGLLTGKYRRGAEAPEGTRLRAPRYARLLEDAKLAAVEQLEAFAASRGHTVLELAFAWLLSKPVLASVIAGATAPEQVRANAAAARWVLTPEDLADIDRITPGGAASSAS
jgi:aryl-alcohol dehydrogenase-like predicted oxidoreductase